MVFKFNMHLFLLYFILIKHVYNYEIYEHSEILILQESYQITLISKLNTNLNSIDINNKTFYYFNKSEPNFENIIKNYYPIIYFENIDEFLEIENNLQKYSKYINAIIINDNNTNYINNINIENIFIFLYNDQIYNNIIKEKYLNFNINNTCSIKLTIIFKTDIISKEISLYLIIFFIILLSFWIFIFIKSIIKKQNLFVHSTLLLIIILYLIHSILLMKWMYSFDYDDIEGNYSLPNMLFLFARFFLFFIKIIIGFSLCYQLNLIELREHYNLIKESKSPLIHVAIIGFILCFESYSSFIDNPNIYISTSEVFNIFYYIFIILVFIYRYSKIKQIIKRRIYVSFPERGLDLPSLLIKNKTLIKHSYILILLNIAIIIIYMCTTFLLYEYKNMKMSILLLHYYDVLFLIGLIIVYFPKKIDDYYIEYSFLEGFDLFKNKSYNKNVIIYRKKQNYFNNDNDNEEESLLIKNDLDLFLIENPNYNNNNSINNEDDNDNQNKKFIDLRNIKIGYKYNELNEKIYDELKSIININKK